MTDKRLMTGRFAKAVSSYGENAFVQRDAAVRMSEMLSPYLRDSLGNVLEVGCGSGMLSRMLLMKCRPERLYLNDICAECETSVADVLTSTDSVFLPGDAESIDLPQRLDVVASCSAIQWFHDLKSFFSRVADALNTEGILAFSTFGPDNLKEISDLEGVSLEYKTMEELMTILSERFEVLEYKQEKPVLYFDSALAILRHMKDTGVTGISKQFWTRSRLEDFSRRYDESYRTQEGLSLTYHPIWIIAKVRK